MIDTTSWDTTPDMFGDGTLRTIPQDSEQGTVNDQINSPEQLLAYAE